MNTTELLVKLTDITKRYDAIEGQEGPLVLQGVSLDVKPGELTAIVGPSGSGKSTLLNIIGLLDSPTSGEIVIDGEVVSSLDENQLSGLRNKHIGWVFQSHHLLPQCTVLENVLLPILAHEKSTGTEQTDYAKHLLERVGLSERLTHRPGQLSGGERQRVAVVRSLINKPKLLLADEPTGALDQATSDSLVQLLLELNRELGIALLVVTHAMQVASQMSRVLHMQDGQLLPAEVKA